LLHVFSLKLQACFTTYISMW